MKIMMLAKKPRKVIAFDVDKVDRLLNGYASPGTTVEVAFPDDFDGAQVEQALGRQMMLNGLDHMLETPAIIRKIMWAADNGYDAVVQSNTFDPGIDGGRLSVPIPVIGPFRTTFHMVANLCDRIGVLVPLASHVAYTWRLLRTIGMESFVTDVRPLGIYGMDLQGRIPEITDKASALITGLVAETGAQGVIPLGGALIPYVVDPADLAERTGVPVYNTKSISIRVAEMCVALGLSHSPLTYPRAALTYEDFLTKS